MQLSNINVKCKTKSATADLENMVFVPNLNQYLIIEYHKKKNFFYSKMLMLNIN